jgi:hypothetical protein
MTNISLKEALLLKFPNGISLASSKELCIALFCSTDWFPNVDCQEFTKTGIAGAFKFLAKKKLIIQDSVENESEPINEENYWIQLINNSMVTGSFYDRNHVKDILKE